MKAFVSKLFKKLAPQAGVTVNVGTQMGNRWTDCGKKWQEELLSQHLF